MLGLKIVGCVFVIASTAGMGFYFTCILKSRLEELKELKKIVVLLRGNIRYANTPLPEALQSLSFRHHGCFQLFLQWVSEQMEQMEGVTIADIWRQGVDMKLKGCSLNKKDREALIGFGANLGYLDKDMQLGTIDLYIATLEAEIEEASKTVREKTYLYNSLGLMAGIFITIILL